MFTLLRKLRPYLEPTIAVVFFVLWVVAEAGRQHGGSAWAALITISVAIAVSRIWPWAALAAVSAVPLLQLVGVLRPPESTTWPVAFGVIFVAFTVSLTAPKRVAYVALALSLPMALAAGALLGLQMNSWVGRGSFEREVEMFVTVAVVAFGLYAGAWGLGFALRLNFSELRALYLLRATAAQLGATESELAMSHERDRIAREVHDVLAHSLAVVIAQADGARFIGEKKPEKTDDALRAIADAARSSLIDVRTLVEGLREDQGDQPQPGLADIPALVKQVSGAGMTVDSQHFGDAKTMTPAQQLAVFRIVQESLTNALRHAGRATTRLSFDWRGPGLALTITSAGIEASESTAGGHGIRGMKDRARLAGGWLTAGASDGDFVVTLFVPTGSERPAEGEAA
ncbi:sensor histidine kinase [Conyzicola sp.]|uniref:sensor histidine kinase n=1 Tax=Conyzicola sp. TaxID=1969404 RepID=UPI003988BDC2